MINSGKHLSILILIKYSRYTFGFQVHLKVEKNRASKSLQLDNENTILY